MKKMAEPLSPGEDPTPAPLTQLYVTEEQMTPAVNH
jgi:hypothetical protein